MVTEKGTIIWTPIKKLLFSRKFLLTLVAIILLVLQDYLGVDPEMIEHISYLLMVLVGAIAVEDGAATFGTRKTP